MNVGLVLTLIIIGVIVSIAVGYKFKINTGVIAMTFAYIIGCFVMNMKVSAVVATWPLKIAFMLMTITMFYGYAVQNGTLKAMADKMLYSVRNIPWAVPWAIWIICAILAGIGTGAPAVTAFMAPIGFLVASQTGINPLLVILAISTGSLAGSNSTFSQGGVIIRGLLEGTPYESQAMLMTTQIWGHSLLKDFLTFFIFYLVFKGYKLSKIQMEKPEPFTPVQKKNFYIIMGVMGAILLPVFVQLIVPNPVTATMIKYFDIQMLAAVGALLCAIFKLGNEKAVIKDGIPWNTIVMVGGISMLMGVAAQAGAVEYIASWVGNSIPPALVGVALVFVSGGLSFFSGAITVVTPMLLPIIPALAEQTGLNPVMLASAILIGSCCTAISPFSTGGSLLLAGCTSEGQRDGLFYKQFVLTLIVWVLVAVMALVGVFNVFHL